MTIRTRLLSTYLALTGTGILLIALVTLVSFRRYVIDSLRADLTARVAAVSQSVIERLARDDHAGARVVVERYGAQEDVTMRLFAPDGTLLATSENGDFQHHGLDRELAGVPEALAGRDARGLTNDVIGHDDRLFEAVPLMRSGAQIGVLRMSRTLSPFQDQMRRTELTLAAALGAVFVAATLVSLRLARNLAEPVQRMSRFAVDLGRGQLGGHLDIQRPDELGQLAIELNRMSQRLAALDEERRAFLASASHELRTPLSNVHVTLEALESGAAGDPELCQRFLRSALDETSRMVRLIQELLDLGRLEAGVSTLEQQPTTLQHVVDRLHRAMEPRLRDAAVSIAVDLVDAPIAVDTERMLQALMNVLDNALRYSPPRSTVHLRARTDDGRAVLSIEDEGPGISPADLPHVFEQFWVKDPSRKRESTGLGLPIARKIVEGHGGTISASSAPGRGAMFTISLPLRAVPAAAA